MIISHLDEGYIKQRIGHNNGAYWYSKELLENIVPYIKTDRNWILINASHKCYDHSVVFIHGNIRLERYYWLGYYKDLVLICSQLHTMKNMLAMFPQHKVLYLPLSIDTEYVKKFSTNKIYNTCYFGRFSKITDELKKNPNVKQIYGNDREELLKEVAKYKYCYAIGRCALEAKCLGCKILNFAERFIDYEHILLDNKDVIPILQTLLDTVDGVV